MTAHDILVSDLCVWLSYVSCLCVQCLEDRTGLVFLSSSCLLLLLLLLLPKNKRDWAGASERDRQLTIGNVFIVYLPFELLIWSNTVSKLAISEPICNVKVASGFPVRTYVFGNHFLSHNIELLQFIWVWAIFQHTHRQREREAERNRDRDWERNGEYTNYARAHGREFRLTSEFAWRQFSPVMETSVSDFIRKRTKFSFT